MIWDLSKEDENLVASSGIGDDTHREPITQLVWLQDPDKPKRWNVRFQSEIDTLLSFLHSGSF